MMVPEFSCEADK